MWIVHYSYGGKEVVILARNLDKVLIVQVSYKAGRRTDWARYRLLGLIVEFYTYLGIFIHSDYIFVYAFKYKWDIESTNISNLLSSKTFDGMMQDLMIF